MIVVYYLDCAPIFFLFFCLLSRISFESPSPHPLSPITYSRSAASYRQSRPLTYGAFAPFLYPCYTFGIGLLSFAIDDAKIR